MKSRKNYFQNLSFKNDLEPLVLNNLPSVLH